MCGKEKIYTEYIALEQALGEVDRCRTLYNNYLKAMPHNCRAWSKFAELEKLVGETDRCRALFELAISQPALDMPEMLWKGYIDFEIEEGEAERARKLYERLLEKTGHVKVWISFAQFEATPIGKGTDTARDVFQRGYEQLKAEGLSEERVLLLDEWRTFEKESGDAASLAKVDAKMPRRIKRKRMREGVKNSGDGKSTLTISFQTTTPAQLLATTKSWKWLQSGKSKWRRTRTTILILIATMMNRAYSLLFRQSEINHYFSS